MFTMTKPTTIVVLGCLLIVAACACGSSGTDVETTSQASPLPTPVGTTFLFKQAYEYHMTGNHYYGQGDFERALQNYTDAITKDPKQGASYYKRGLTHQELGDDTAAASDLQKAKELGHTPGDEVISTSHKGKH